MKQASTHKERVSSCWESRGRTGGGVKATRLDILVLMPGPRLILKLVYAVLRNVRMD